MPTWCSPVTRCSSARWGRTDLFGGSGRDLLTSIIGKLLVLDDETVVLPGHGNSTTIGAERRFNPFLEGL